MGVERERRVRGLVAVQQREDPQGRRQVAEAVQAHVVQRRAERRRPGGGCGRRRHEDLPGARDVAQAPTPPSAGPAVTAFVAVEEGVLGVDGEAWSRTGRCVAAPDPTRGDGGGQSVGR